MVIFNCKCICCGLSYHSPDLDSNFCDKSGGRYGHVITIIDLTSNLQNAQIDFIKDQVFSREFYMSYTPHTKFSYILIDDKKAQEQKFLFTKCRPRTGDTRFSKKEAIFYMFKQSMAAPDCILTKTTNMHKKNIIYNLELQNKKKTKFTKMDDLIVLLKRREFYII